MKKAILILFLATAAWFTLQNKPRKKGEALPVTLDAPPLAKRDAPMLAEMRETLKLEIQTLETLEGRLRAERALLRNADTDGGLKTAVQSDKKDLKQLDSRLKNVRQQLAAQRPSPGRKEDRQSLNDKIEAEHASISALEQTLTQLKQSPNRRANRSQIQALQLTVRNRSRQLRSWREQRRLLGPPSQNSETLKRKETELLTRRAEMNTDLSAASERSQRTEKTREEEKSNIASLTSQTESQRVKISDLKAKIEALGK